MGKSGRRREWARATDNTDVFDSITDDDVEFDDNDDAQAAESEQPMDVQSRLRRWAMRRLRRFRQAVIDRTAQLCVTIVAGLALCASFPPFGWWFMAIAAFGLLAW